MGLAPTYNHVHVQFKIFRFYLLGFYYREDSPKAKEIKGNHTNKPNGQTTHGGNQGSKRLWYAINY